MSTTRGGRNLAILGVGSILLAGITTSISLAMYHISGDIYLDRSRPGYLPDEEEVENDTETTSSFSFSDSGPITAEDLDEYLKAYHTVDTRLKTFNDPYSPVPLSDESLGIPSEFAEEDPNIEPFSDGIDFSAELE